MSLNPWIILTLLKVCQQTLFTSGCDAIRSVHPFWWSNLSERKREKIKPEVRPVSRAYCLSYCQIVRYSWWVKEQVGRNQGKSISQIHNIGHSTGQISYFLQQTKTIFKRRKKRRQCFYRVWDVTTTKSLSLKGFQLNKACIYDCFWWFLRMTIAEGSIIVGETS